MTSYLTFVFCILRMCALQVPRLGRVGSWMCSAQSRAASQHAAAEPELRVWGTFPPGRARPPLAVCGVSSRIQLRDVSSIDVSCLVTEGWLVDVAARDRIRAPPGMAAALSRGATGRRGQRPVPRATPRRAPQRSPHRARATRARGEGGACSAGAAPREPRGRARGRADHPTVRKTPTASRPPWRENARSVVYTHRTESRRGRDRL